MTTNLAGVTVLVTRPQHQQQAFIELLHSLGAETRSLPCIDIRWKTEQARKPLNALTSDQILIFTSPNAVHAANAARPMPWRRSSDGPAGESMSQRNAPSGINSDQLFTVLAIGPATAKTLHEHGMPVRHEPCAPYNSEALLSSPELQKNNLQKVSIIKGTGGRHYIADCLQKRAITVETVDVYERFKPAVDAATLEAIFLKSAVDIVTITSNEALQNLVDIVDKPLRDRLLKLPLVVNSQRGAQLAKDLCFQSHILVAPVAGDSGQLEAIKFWNSSYRFKL